MQGPALKAHLHIFFLLLRQRWWRGLSLNLLLLPLFNYCLLWRFCNHISFHFRRLCRCSCLPRLRSLHLFLLLFLVILINLNILHWLRLNIDNVVIYCVSFSNGFRITIFTLNLNITSRPSGNILIHLLQNGINLHLCCFDNLVSYSFFHQIDLALSNYLH